MPFLIDLKTLLALFGLSMTGLTCAGGCNGGDGGGYTMTDFHQDNAKYGVKWRGKLKVGNNSSFYTKQEAGFNSPFDFEGEASNDGEPVLADGETDTDAKENE